MLFVYLYSAQMIALAFCLSLTGFCVTLLSLHFVHVCSGRETTSFATDDKNLETFHRGSDVILDPEIKNYDKLVTKTAKKQTKKT